MAINRILISQPAPSSEQKSPFTPLKERFSLNIDFHPLIAVEGVKLQEFISQRVKILDHTAVIFTSRSLIDNFFRLVGESRLTIPDGMKYFCISEAVALYLQKYIVYRKRKIFFASGSVTSLMEIILKHNTEKYFLALSEPFKPELPMAMETAALSHSRAVLSHTVCREPKDLDIKGYDIVALYSPIEVKNFQASFLDNGYVGKLAVFGEATAKAALAQGLKIDIMAPTPKFPSMAAAITAYCKVEQAGGDLHEFAVENLSDDAQAELLKMAEKRRCRNIKATSANIIKGKVSSRSATPRSVSMAAAKTLVKK